MINLEDEERKMYSQNGEDGITIKLIQLLNYSEDSLKYYVEFGAEDGSQCNTRILREMLKWGGLLMDGSNENLYINLRKEFITKENIISLFQKYNIPINFNLLSIDIDYNDFYCLMEILTVYEPDIIICEYNSSHLPHEDKIVIYNPNAVWDGTNYFGASLLSLKKLANSYGYSLVHCDSIGINAFFVKTKLLIEKNINIKNCDDIEKLYKTPKYNTGINGGHKQDYWNRKYISYDEVIQNNKQNKILNKIVNLKNILYINLATRPDRKTHIESELKKLNFIGTRFDALTHPVYAARGCALSHTACLQMALDNKWNHILVLEDDAEFLNPELFLTQLNKFLQRHSTWDVLILAGNNVGPYEIIDETCVKISKCLTTTAYLVNEQYIPKLLNNFQESLDKFTHIDRWWNNLQVKDNWMMLTPLTVIQKTSYSDIENKVIDYTDFMLKLAK